MAATTPAKLLARMQRLAEEQVNKDFMGLLYGPPGGGKTTLSVALAKRLAGDDGEVLYVDSSDGWVSLENIEGLTDGVSRIEFDSLGDIIGIADAIKKRAKGFENFRAIVIDELSSVAEDVLFNVVRNRAGLAKNEIVEDIEGKDYGPMGQMVLIALDALHDIEGLHVIIVAHERQKKDHRNVEVTFPGFSPLLRQGIMKRMHVAGFVSATIKGAGKNTEYIREVQAQPSGLIVAKSRIGGMPLKTDFFDFIDIIEDWVGGVTMAADISNPEPEVDVAEDEIPTDGVPVTEFEDSASDEEADYAGALE